MFWYSLSTALMHREDTVDIVLPPPYEMYPYFFVHSDVIQKAHKHWMMRKTDCTFYVPLQDATLVASAQDFT
jgi:hypothetical protein